VQQFLAAMVDSSETDRRRYERVSGDGSRATLRVAGRIDAEITIKDISRGGIALICDWPLPAGMEIEVVLPGAAGPLSGRVARAENGLVIATFRHDPTSLGALDRALDTIARRPVAKAA
jgi:hypothetical protein